MTVGVFGLGLIGGSFVRAIKQYTLHTVYGYNRTRSITQAALREGVVDDELTDDTLPACDLLILSAYPGANTKYLSEKAPLLASQTIVIDCAGVKRSVCAVCEPIAEQHGFTFIGGHPMAGLEYSGFSYARADLFCDASMILTPAEQTDPALLANVRDFFLSLGFLSVPLTTPETHDRVIAFTSQLAHVVSNAYMKSPRAEEHKGFSAGSYRDLTRVARLNPGMWAELFLANRDNLSQELDTLIEELSLYRSALNAADRDRLFTLLKEGSDRKERIDG